MLKVMFLTFTRMAVCIENTIVAGTAVASYRIVAVVMAAPIVGGALINIYSGGCPC